MKLPLSKHIWVVLILATFPIGIFSQTETPSFGYELIYMNPKAPSTPGDTIPDKYIVLNETDIKNLEKLIVIKQDNEYSYTKDQLSREHLRSEGGTPRVYIPIGKANEDAELIVTGLTTKNEVLVYNKVPDEIEKLMIKQEREKSIPFEKKYDIKQKPL
jgi:hypothetical protein